MSHRNVDVDLGDEEEYVEEDTKMEQSDSQLSSELAQKTKTIQSLLNTGSLNDALKESLTNIPGTKAPQNIKDGHTSIIMQVLNSFKNADVSEAVKSLPLEDVDLLVKYIYRGMAQPDQYNAAILLTWHEKAVEVGGLGSIVRVLTDQLVV